MKKTKKIKSFLAKNGKIAKSVLVIAVVLSAVGITYALFSDRASTEANALSSSSVDLKIKLPATDCNDWSDTCPGKQWASVYPGWQDSYEVYLKNVSSSDIDLSILPVVEETGSSQALYENTYLEITWKNGGMTTGRYNLGEWKTNTTLELETLAQNEESSPYLIKLDIPKTVGNEIADSEIEFNLAFNATQILKYSLTVTADPSAGGTVTGSGQYPDGDLAEINAIPAENFEFANWEGAGITDVNAASTTILMDGSKTVTAVFETDLLADWNFNEGSGATLTDISGYGNNGTISGATWAAGKEGSALQFDGMNDYVSIPYNSNFDLGATSQFTIEYWFNRHATEWHAAFSQLSTSEIFGIKSHYASRFWWGGDEHMWTLAKTVSNPDDPMETPEVTQRFSYPSLNAWHHVANVYNGTTMTTYIDGVQTGNTIDVTGVALAPAANYPNLIGAQQNGDYQGNYFDGLIDEMRIWKKALSLAEIQDHYLNP
ncbi:MAG: LamG-like jellyroll fold domain-containing protein [Patescibacteria group bacterium]